MANIDLVRDKTGIKSKDGGRHWWYRRVNSDGSSVAGQDWVVGVYKEKTDIDYSEPLNIITDEIGDQVATDTDDIKFEIQITSLQADSKTLNFLLQETGPTKFYAICWHDGLGLNGTNKYGYSPLGNFAKQIKKGSPSNQRPVFAFTGLAPTTAWNGNSLTGTTITTCTPNPNSLTASLSGAAGEYLVFAEV